MSNIKARSQSFRLDNMRGTFLYLLAPQKRQNPDGSIKLSYSGTFLWPKSIELKGRTELGEEIDVVQEAVRVATEAWGDKAVELIKNGAIKSPFLDGDGPQAVNKKTGARHKGFEGHKFLRASATADYPPWVIDNKRGADGKIVVLTDKSRVKWGAYYHPTVQLMAWEHVQSGKGLSFGLGGVQYAKDGESLGSSGGPDPNSFFEGAPQAASTAAATSGAGAGGLFA